MVFFSSRYCFLFQLSHLRRESSIARQFALCNVGHAFLNEVLQSREINFGTYTTMHNEWKKFLQDQQAVIDAQGQLRFASAAAEAHAVNEQNVIADLSPLGIIRVSGEDAGDFLQGQFSNDVKLVDEQTAQLSSYCNPKGRILASFWLYREGDAFYMLLPAETVAATLKRLRMFVLM